MKVYIFIVLLVLISSCVSVKSDTSYDFDHQVQFKQKISSDGIYNIQVVSTNKTSFEQLTTFLFRHSYKLCGSYGFTLEILNGVEGIDDRKVSPGYIQPSLMANLSCPSHSI